MVANPLFWCLVLTASLQAVSLPAQDLFDSTRTRQYAQFLIRGGNFAQAGAEYQRLVFMHPQNDTFKVHLLRAYRLGAQYDLGSRQWEAWRGQTAPLPSDVNAEYAKLLMYAGRSPEAFLLASVPGLIAAPQRDQIQLYSSLLAQEWPRATEIFQNWPPQAPLANKTSIAQLLERANQQHYKKPWLAAGMSAIVPGSGKAYTNDWTDGAIAFLFVGMNTWQSWRRFDREGIRSFWGWFHGGFAAGFYIGNVYGAHKAARMYNQRKKLKLAHETEHILFPDF